MCNHWDVRRERIEDGGDRGRREIVHGRQPVRELLRAARRRVFRVLFCAEPHPGGVVTDIVAMAREHSLAVRQITAPEMARLCGEGHHQGVAAEVSGYPYVDRDALWAAAAAGPEPPLILVLDHIQDPQNLGAILRASDAAGAHGLILPRDRAAAVTPAAVRASAGASEHAYVARVTNLVREMEWLKSRGVWLVGLEGVPEAKLHTGADLKGALGLVVGSEGEGLGRLVREHCDFLIRLPMRGRVNSLNASAACAVALYEIRRQRDSLPGGASS